MAPSIPEEDIITLGTHGSGLIIGVRGKPVVNEVGHILGCICPKCPTYDKRKNDLWLKLEAERDAEDDLPLL